MTRQAAKGRLWDRVREEEARHGEEEHKKPANVRDRGISNLLAAIGRDPLIDTPGRERKQQALIKAELIAEGGSACRSCGVVMPSDSLMHTHHVVPVARGGHDIKGNCVLLCPNCHAVAHWIDRTTPKEERPATPGDLLRALAAQ
jgi:5-methylcytosine-specific restriction endonuclease McrA